MTTAIRAAARAIKALAALTALTTLLAGLPYALIRFVGWPLPRTVPTWNGIQQALTHQITGPILYIDTLACLLWACWAVLALSFIVELGYALARIPAPHVPGLGPGQILAAALIAALGLSVTARPASAATPRLSAHLTAPSAASAPLQPSTNSSTTVAASDAHAATEAVHTVVPGDSLWTIAQEDLGNGKDWPRIYQLNADKAQPGGGALTDPDLIKPGWTLRITPETPAVEPTSPAPSASSQAGAQSHPGPPAAAPGSPQGTATTAQPHVPASSATPRPAGAGHTRDTAPPARARRTSPVSLTLPEGGLVGVSLSAALAAAVLAWRRQRRRAASPYWNARHIPHEPHLPAAVGAIHQAHLTLTATQADDEDDLDAFGAPTTSDRPPTVPPPPHHGPDPASAPASASGWARPQPAGVIAVARDGAREALLEAAGGGFGLAGAHAIPAARAILAAILAAHDPGAPEARPRLVIPADDLDLLLAPHTATPADHQISALTVTGDLDAALSAGEAELLHRARLLEHSEAEDLDHLAAEHPDLEDPAPLYLLATRSHPAAERITTLCENGARLRIAVILLAGHPARPTLTPGPDGTLTDPQALLLPGSQLFHLPADALREILTTLAGAETTAQDEPPPTPPEHLEPDDDEPREDHDPQDDQGAGDTPAQQTPPTRAIPPGPDARPRGEEPGLQPSDGRDHAEQDPDSSSPPAPAPDPKTRSAGHDATPTTPPAPPEAGPAQPGTGPGASDGEPHPVQVWERGLVRIQLTGPLRLLARGPEGWSEITRGLRSDAWPVLALLALHRRDPITAQDAEQIWPDLPPEQVRRKLTDALKSLRTTLRRETGAGSAEFFPPGQGRYRLDPRLVSADTWCLHAAATDASRRADPKAKREGFEAALTHYHGDLASDRAGDAFAFLDEWREPARRRALSTAAAAGQLAEQHGDLEAALAHFETALAIDPLIEETSRHIMTLQHRLGRPTDIRATARALEHRLQNTLGVLPAPATRTLVSQLLGDHPPPPPPAPRPAPSRTAPTTTPPTRPAVGSTHRRAS